MADAIKIKVKDLREKDSSPWIMTIGDRRDIKAYMHRGSLILIHYQGDLYECTDITEEQLLDLCPHLKTKEPCLEK